MIKFTTRFTIHENMLLNIRIYIIESMDKVDEKPLIALIIL